MTDAPKTNAERLDALLARYAPKAVAYHKKHGWWPGETSLLVSPEQSIAIHALKLVQHDGVSAAEAEKLAQSADNRKRSAPYVIKTTDEGRRILITTDDGNTVAGSGATIGDALTQLEGVTP